MRIILAKPTGNLKRYTTLAAAIDLVGNKRLALLSPSTWKDKNDVRFLDKYCNLSGYKSIRAACFTQRPETYHHWQVFAGLNEGVCIEIDRGALLSSLSENDEYISRNVKYMSLKQLSEANPLKVSDLPFLKRQGFGDEAEFRLIWRGKDEASSVHHVPIELSWVKKIVLNPWMNEGLLPAIQRAFWMLPGGASITVSQSTLIDNARWKDACESLDEFDILLDDRSPN